MVDLGLFDVLFENPVASGALVAIELVGGVDAAGDGPSRVDFGLRKGRRRGQGGMEWKERERGESLSFSVQTNTLERNALRKKRTPPKNSSFSSLP